MKPLPQEAELHWRDWLQENEPELDNLLHEYRQACYGVGVENGVRWAIERKIVQLITEHGRKQTRAFQQRLSKIEGDVINLNSDMLAALSTPSEQPNRKDSV